MIGNATGSGAMERPGEVRWFRQVAETILLVALVFVYAGTPPPDVNEAHYLVKAKHCWDTTWCGRDVFLDSADAHAVFYRVFGWPTRWMSLPAVAWCGRVLTWVAVAWAWQRLSWSILPVPLMSVLSAAWFLMLNSVCHLAGEWAIGGFEAKALAYACVLWGVQALVRQRWNWVWIWLGAATAMHVLVGGWTMVAAAGVWLLSSTPRPTPRSMWPGLLAGSGLALAGLVPALALSTGVDVETATQANMIYVFQRLPHHLVFHAFAPTRLLLFGLLLIGWLAVSRRAWHCSSWLTVHRFALAALTIAIAGIAVDLLLYRNPVWAAKLLRFYWFRLADVAVPLAVSLAIPLALERGWSSRRRIARLLVVVAVVIPALWLGRVFVQHQRDFRPGGIVQSSPGGAWSHAQRIARYRSWQDVCRWIDQHTPPPARFLTPRNQQTFKWYAQRAEVACWKDIPQDQASIVQWWQTLSDIFPPAVAEHGLDAWSDEQLRELAERYQVDYIVVDRAYTHRGFGLPRVYPTSPQQEDWFEIYELRMGNGDVRGCAP